MGGDAGSGDPSDGEPGTARKEQEHGWPATGEASEILERALGPAIGQPLGEALDLALGLAEVARQRARLLGAPFAERADLAGQGAQRSGGAVALLLSPPTQLVLGLAEQFAELVACLPGDRLRLIGRLGTNLACCISRAAGR